MAYYMNKNVPAKRGDIFYISNSKCYATDPSNAEGRPAIVVSSDKLNEHADVVEVVYLTTTAIKQELVKEVVVPCYSYQTGTILETVVGEEVSVKSGDTVTYYIGEPCYGYSASLENVTGGVKVIDSGSYYITDRSR